MFAAQPTIATRTHVLGHLAWPTTCPQNSNPCQRPPQPLRIALDRAQKRPRRAARTLPAPLPLLHRPHAELVGRRELRLRHARRPPYRPHIDLRRHVRRRIRITRDLRGNIRILHRIHAAPIRRHQRATRRRAQCFRYNTKPPDRSRNAAKSPADRHPALYGTSVDTAPNPPYNTP